MTSNTRRIKTWMVSNGLAVKDLAEKAQVSRSLVYLFLAGASRNKKIVQTLESLGCPKKFIGD